MDVDPDISLFACDVCGGEHDTEDCAELKQEAVVTKQLTKARITLPENLQCVTDQEGKITVTSQAVIPIKTRLGPFESPKTTEETSHDPHTFILKLFFKAGGHVTLLTNDENDCNWLCLVQTAVTSEEQNCMALQIGGSIYYMVTKAIGVGEELRVWYAPHYAKKLGKSPNPDGVTKVVLLPISEVESESLAVPYVLEEATLAVTEDNMTVDWSVGDVTLSVLADGSTQLFSKESHMVIAEKEEIAEIADNVNIEVKQETQVTRPNTQKKHRCSQCREDFVSGPLLNQHRFLIHNIRDTTEPKNLLPTRIVSQPGSEFMCKRCGKPCENTKSLALHVREHLVSECGLRTSRGRPRGSTKPLYHRKGRKRKRLKVEDEENIQPYKESVEDTEDSKSVLFPSDGAGLASTETSVMSSNYVTDKQVEDNLLTSGLGQERENHSRAGAEDNLTSSITKAQESLQEKTTMSDTADKTDNDDMFEKVNETAPVDVALNETAHIILRCDDGKTDSERATAAVSNVKNDKVTESDSLDSGNDISLARDKRNSKNKHVVEDKTLELSDAKRKKCESRKRLKKNALKNSTEVKPVTPAKDLDNYCKNCDRTFKRRATFVKHICLVKFIKKEPEPDDHKPDVEKNDIVDSDDADGDDDDENFIPNKMDMNEFDEEDNKDDDDDNFTPNKTDVNELVHPRNKLRYNLKSSPNSRKTRSGTKRFSDVNLERKKSSAAKNCVENTSKTVSSKKGKLQKGGKKDTSAALKTTLPVGPDKCSQCNLTFKKVQNIKYHKCSKDSDKYHCIHCSKVFEAESRFNRHVKKYGGLYICNDCNVTFSTKTEEKQHSCNKSILHCSSCFQSFETSQETTGHSSVCDTECIKEIPKKGLTFHSCNMCKNVYTKKQALKVHAEKEHDLPTCTVCGTECISHNALQRHMKKHNFVFNCDKCDRHFARKEGLLSHYALCSPDRLKGPEGEDLYHPCKECDKIYETKSTLDDHIAERHVDGPVNCDICGYEFDTVLYLYRHMATHTDQFSCIRCNKSFARNESLLSHYIDCYPEALNGVTGGKKYYPCTKCRKVFAKSASLENHLKSHENAFQCEHCHKNFGNASTLSKHNCSDDFEEGESTGDLYYCQYCGRSFNTQQHVDRHSAIHTGEFTCKLCSKVYSRKSELQRHELQCMANVAVETNGKVKCSVCEAEFDKVKQFVEHYNEHTHSYKCSDCNRKFLRKMGLENHKCVGLADSDQVKCELCNKLFQSENYLENHMKSHNEPNVVCSACGKTFNSYKLLLRPHKCLDEDGNEIQVKMKKLGENKYIMAKTEPLICPLCGKMFQSTSNLNKHLITHGEKNEMCSLCGKKFHLKANLAVHMDSHEKIGRHQCMKCGKRLKNIHSLHIHMKHMHDSNYKGHPCPECGKLFKQRSNMLKHQLTHLDKRTFECSTCSKSFKCKEHLTRHNIWHEYGERYQCGICKQMFVMNHELTRHEKLYHSGYMYQCPYCKIVCRLPNTMKRHLTRRHDAIPDWKANTMDFIKSGMIYDEKYKDFPDDVIKSEEGDKTDSDETTVILQAESQDGNPPQTFVIKGNNIQADQTISQEVAEALQKLSNRGILDSEENTTISIIGDIQSSSGESIPIAFQSGNAPDSEGYIIVPVVDKTQPDPAIKTLVNENEFVNVSNSDEHSLTYDVVPGPKQVTTAAQLNTIAAHYSNLATESQQQVVFSHDQIPDDSQSNIVTLNENHLIQSGLNQTELLKALQSNNVQLVLGDSIGGVSQLETDHGQPESIEITMTDVGSL